MDRLAWDTVAWIAEMPEHMIHLEKQGTLEPRSEAKEHQDKVASFRFMTLYFFKKPYSYTLGSI